MRIDQLVNQNSFLAAAGLVIVLVQLLVVWRIRHAGILVTTFLPLVLGFVILYLLFRVGSSEITSADQFDRIRLSDKSTILEIYSNY